MKVLIIEDDEDGAAFLASGIAERGHEADVARNGRDGLVMATGPQRYDVVIVDRMLPELDGLSLVKAMRAAGSATPALFLTSLSGIDDRVEGLDAGGDDYLVKPFAFTELMAHKLAGNVMWAYLIAHASAALLHQARGDRIFARMFWVRRRRRTHTAPAE